MELTQERLKELLHYDPDTGVFTWLAKADPVKSRTVIGSVAGYFGSGGEKLIAFDGVAHRADRLAFLYMTGKHVKYIKHINCIPSNCQWSNMIETTKQEMRDRHTHKFKEW